ncbi:MAG: bifunctional methylenetetrahydrofolate dehydrogenase/methenyltetrahydrofolate cyclohydrolase FolD [Chitinivibrionia bacterium]|nr:bifunctional methylenetetrahydrofolate dehydrogenase/methenyltetrahydrofolate cyclohydrolase FolD [Chitinivibrionia bacterium]
MELLDGKALAETIQREVRDTIASFASGARPSITLVQVGDDPASSVYVRGKARACEECGITSDAMHLSRDIKEETLLGILKDLSGDSSVSAILLQLPLPRHIDEAMAIAAISPIKDVDGFHPENMGLLVAGTPRYIACTPLGIRELLVRNGIATAGKRAVVLGRSLIVGKPMALVLSMKGEGGDATVTMCNSRTPDLADHTARADIVVAAMGKPRFVTAGMIKEGAVVVDVGINRIEDPSKKSGYRLVGDVDFEEVSKKASYITPVPGGVGPMTIAMLMVNTLKAFTVQVKTPNVLS